MHQKRFADTSNRINLRAALLAASLFSGAQATTYTVNTTNMNLVNDGNCGLREAIDAVNSMGARWGCPAPNASASIINLPAGTFTTPTPIALIHSMSIRCPSGTCTIDAGTINGDLFTNSGGFFPDITLYRLTLRQSSGNTNSISGVVMLGGALKLEESVVTGFKTVGVSLRAGTDHSILRSTLSYNGYGLTLWEGVGLVSQSNTVSNNWMGIQTGKVVFKDNGSVIANNTDAGIYFGTASTIDCSKTIVRGNGNRGIFIGTYGEGLFNDCTIEKNRTAGDGAGMYISAIKDTNGSGAHVTVYASTISENKAGGYGGGVYVTGALTLTNVTLSLNSAARGGGGYYEQYTSTSYLDFAKSTIAFNTATVSGGGLVSITSGANFHTTGCIVAKNTANPNPDVSGNITSRQTLYGNVTGFTGTHDNDKYPSDPLLGPLMDNAGPNRVLTHALLKGSPAIDVGTDQSSAITDARGLPRPASGTWDLGAYEVGPFETELLTVIGKSSDTHMIQGTDGLSNLAGTVLNANAIGDYVIYAVAVPEAGTYKIEIGTLSGPDRATVELATAPGTDQFTTIGSFNMYKSSQQPGVYSLSFPFTSGSVKYFRLKVTGRDPLNTTGYKCFFDYIKITKQ